MLIDTHAHVNFRSFKDDAIQVMQRALDAGVNVINVGSQIDTSRQAVELANSFEKGVYAVVGLHPEHTHSQYVDEEETHFLSREENFNYDEYKKLALDKKVVGIGECGLDYYRLPEDKNLHKEVKEKQKAAFKLQLKLAKELNKALVVHSRSSKGTDDACLDILEILKSESGIMNQESQFVLHSYTGSPEVAKMFLDLGGFISFNGIITFDKTGNMESLVKMVPMDRMILETDSPYLTPVPNRGKRNEPAYVRFVAEHVARVKRLSVLEVEGRTTENAKVLFGI